MAKVYCDRHRGLVDGLEDEDCTGGFYRRSGWPDFFDAGEERVCDDCMFADPRYIKVYGRHVTTLSLGETCKLALDMGHGVTYTMDAIVENFDIKADHEDVTTRHNDYSRFVPGLATARVVLRAHGVQRSA